jgi:SMC interacting uncharacterized protein involved in chromosome segregation
MTKQERIIDTIKTLRQVNAECMAEHVDRAREMESDHNVYTELVDFHRGKMTAYDQILELLEAA